ncbi:MAG: CDP-alcohol phosphatidyltransferase family protein [Gemmatimonadaceae bacterium]|nr:CDP-alcohol phosphatidyltransferase family protein [Gemmatimonadaceae bacterium]
MNLNLPTWITAGRIIATPLICWLPFQNSSTLRLLAFALYLVTAVSDYWDGKLARSRKQETDLGRFLDPLADKLLLLATFIPMFVLQAPHRDWLGRILPRIVESSQFAFVPWVIGSVALPWWVLIVVLGREAFMTAFRTLAHRRGTAIEAIGPGKWKAGMQYTWVGAAYFWFALKTYIEEHDFVGTTWTALAHGTGTIGVVSGVAAVILTFYSLGLYLSRYRHLLRV